MNYTTLNFELHETSEDDYYLGLHENNMCGQCCPYCDMESEEQVLDRRGIELQYEEAY